MAKDSWREGFMACIGSCFSRSKKRKHAATPYIQTYKPVLLLFIWEFPKKWEVPPNHPKLDKFSLKTYGFGDPPHGLKAPDWQTWALDRRFWPQSILNCFLLKSGTLATKTIQLGPCLNLVYQVSVDVHWISLENLPKNTFFKHGSRAVWMDHGSSQVGSRHVLPFPTQKTW